MYQVIFRGTIAEGHASATVRQQLGQRFGLSAQRLDALFSGRPVVVKKGLDRDKAERLQAAFGEVGAVCEIRAEDGAAPAAAQANAGAAARETGAERTAAADPNRTIVDLPVRDDVDDLSLAPPETYHPTAEPPPAPAIDTSELAVIDDGGPLEARDDGAAPPDIDTSGLDLEPMH